MLRRCWQALFALTLTAVLLTEAAPELTAHAFYLLTDGITTVVTGSSPVERVGAEKIISVGAAEGGDVILRPNQKVIIRRGESEQLATSRSGESVSALLQRAGVSVGALELVRVDLSDENSTLLEIASDFTYYETLNETAEFRTVYTSDYTMPKGQVSVLQAGQNGTRDVTYEVVYADGQLVSRQAVAESNNTSVTQTAKIGLLVQETQPGDTIASVVQTEDGGGYLLMKSGDALHFTGSMDVRCTAYTANVGKVGTRTATGTTARVGEVAVDRKVIPLGTRMFVATNDGSYTYGMATAEDTGVRGKTVDLYMDTYDECILFGVRSSTVYFLDN